MALKSKPLESVRPDVPVHEVAPTEEVVKLTFNVPKSTRLKWKEAALKREKTVTDLIIEAMGKHLS